jgi:hypothetical protein
MTPNDVRTMPASPVAPPVKRVVRKKVVTGPAGAQPEPTAPASPPPPRKGVPRNPAEFRAAKSPVAGRRRVDDGFFIRAVPRTPVAPVDAPYVREDPVRRRRTVRPWTILVATTLVLLLVAGAVAQRLQNRDDDVMERYAAREIGVRGEGTGFSALFPDAPESETETQPVAGALLPVEILREEFKDGAFTIVKSELPKLVDLSQPKVNLRASAESAAAATRGALVAFRYMKMGRDPAAGMLISAGGKFIKGRVVLHGRRMFVIQVVSRASDPPGFTRFVESFRFEGR